jgi:hypothetical protein
MSMKDPNTATAEAEGAKHDATAAGQACTVSMACTSSCEIGAASLSAQQQQQQGPGLQQQVAPCDTDLSGAADAAAVELELACDSSSGNSRHACVFTQQQEKPCQVFSVDAAADPAVAAAATADSIAPTGLGMIGASAAQPVFGADGIQQQQQLPPSDVADEAAGLETVVVQVAGKATDCSSCSSSGSGGSKMVSVTATATAAPVGEEEDVWEVASKQRLQQLQEQQVMHGSEVHLVVLQFCTMQAGCGLICMLIKEDTWRVCQSLQQKSTARKLVWLF